MRYWLSGVNDRVIEGQRRVAALAGILPPTAPADLHSRRLGNNPAYASPQAPLELRAGRGQGRR